MIIRKPIKLKAYRLSYIYKNESYSKYKNNLLLHNLTSNYDLQNKIKQKNNYDNNLTETKEQESDYKNLLLSKSSGINQNNSSSIKSLIKPNLKMGNLILKNNIKNYSIPKKDYKTIINISNSNKSKKKYLYNKNYINNKYRFLPKLKGSKEKKYSMSLFEKERKDQRDRYNEKLREKLLELEECEKKFDVEIFNTLSKLNEEEHKLYET